MALAGRGIDVDLAGDGLLPDSHRRPRNVPDGLFDDAAVKGLEWVPGLRIDPPTPPWQVRRQRRIAHGHQSSACRDPVTIVGADRAINE